MVEEDVHKSFNEGSVWAHKKRDDRWDGNIEEMQILI